MSDVILRDDIDHDIWTERQRQERMKAEGRFTYTCADPEMNDYERLAVLAEEFGEVAREVLEGVPSTLRAELVQVAAVCRAWVEVIDATLKAENLGPRAQALYDAFRGAANPTATTEAE